MISAQKFKLLISIQQANVQAIGFEYCTKLGSMRRSLLLAKGGVSRDVPSAARSLCSGDTMRNQVSTKDMSVRVIAGTYVVLMAMSVVEKARQNLLGFAIGLVENGEVRWLRGTKVFQSVVHDPDPKDDYSSAEHPIQSFIWADFDAVPGTKSVYRVAPVYGPVESLTLGGAIDIDVETEDPSKGAHGIYFNRGAIGAQAFSRGYNSQPPKNPDDPKDRTVKYLSRGMLEATLKFIKRAKAGDALHVAAYEFSYEPIILALRNAAALGVDVRIVYEAGQGRDRETGEIVDTSATKGARVAIKKYGLSKQKNLTLIKRTKRRNIPHNKFIVWVKGGKPKEVLAGSANFTPSGFCGQANVVHIVRDSDVAAAYIEYWNELAKDPTTPDLSTWSKNRIREDELAGLLEQPAIVPFFSPRKNDQMLSWYADRIAGATETVMFTAAFGVNKLLAAQFGIDCPFVRFVLLEDEPDADLRAKLSADRDVWAAAGSLLGAYLSDKKKFPISDLDKWFLKEEHYRDQGNIFFIHTKFLMTDPLTDNPLVMTGSANFSTSSLENNDENMLLIRGDTAVADIYLTEFDRIFRHFYSRQEINRRIENKLPIVEAKFLKETDEWIEPYVKPHWPKTKRQRIFFAHWPN